jgi:hypothetical protein
MARALLCMTEARTLLEECSRRLHGNACSRSELTYGEVFNYSWQFAIDI